MTSPIPPTPVNQESEHLQEMYEALLAWFNRYESVVVAFSGGVDSALVLKAAADALGKERVLAVTADSPSLSRRELGEGSALAAELGVEQVLIKTDEFANPQYRANLGNRCYFCKSTLYQTLIELLARRYPACSQARRALVDGTNADDLSDVRPGRAAAREAGVKHPLVELGINKESVRALSKLRGLKTWNKPEMACLSSRIQTGVSVTEGKIAMIEKAEDGLKALGFSHLRVRYHELKSPGANGERSEEAALSLARLELGEEEQALTPELRRKVAGVLRDAGFSLVTLDLDGYRKGGVPGGNQ